MALIRTKAGSPGLALSKGAATDRHVFRVDWPATGGDVDAVAFVEGADGTKHVLQPLDKNYGSLVSAPFVQHSGDQRAGGQEEITFLADPSKYRRILLWIFKYPQEALPRTDATATLTQPGGHQLVVDLAAAPHRTKALVIGQIVSDGTKLRFDAPPIDKLYFSPGWMGSVHRDIDAAYNWGFNWTTGSKD